MGKLSKESADPTAELTILIVSHKRADKVKTLRWIPTASVCVPDSQVEDYQKHNPNAKIVGHPDSVKGLSAKRNWIIKHFTPVFMIDDDCTRAIYTMDWRFRVLQPGESEAAVRNFYELASGFNCGLWGFAEGRGINTFQPYHPIRFNNHIHGGCMGVNDPELWIPETVVHYDDMWLTCLNRHKGSFSMMDDRYAFCLDKPEASLGGNASNRTTNSILEDVSFLKRNFGSQHFVKKKETSVFTHGNFMQKKRRSDGHVSLRFSMGGSNNE